MINTKKSVSIIIPSYNRKNLLQESLEAIKKQKFNGFLEVIVIDDNSSDGTIEMLKQKAAAKNKFIFKYFESPHLGPARARNLGISYSKGEILIFLDDDSVVQNSDYVQKMVESFKEKDTGIVAGKTLDFYSGILKLIRAGDPPELDFNNPSKLKEAEGVPTKNAAFLREAVATVGGFNPSFNFLSEDTDLCIRIINSGYKLVFNEKALVYHYPTADFISYIKKSYSIGFSHGVFHFFHPNKSPRISLFKIIIFPILAGRKFIKKIKICFAKKLFSQAAIKEISLMFFWISANYCATSFGEVDYLIKRIFVSINPVRNCSRILSPAGIIQENNTVAAEPWAIISNGVKIKLKMVKGLGHYFLELIKYFIKTTFLPIRRTFILYLTNKCNHRCQHCFFSESINKNIQELSLADLKKIAENYFHYTNTKKFLAKSIWQGFTGGEPFLRNDLLKIVSLFKDSGVENFQINTNGMLTEKILSFSREMLKQNTPFKIIISIDGLEKTHDKIRNTPGAFQNAINTIKKLKSIGIEAGTIMTINKLNYKEIPDVVRFLNGNFNIEPGLHLIRGVSQSDAPMEFMNIADPLEKNILITKDIIPELRDILFKTYLAKAIENPLKTVELARKFTYLECHLDILEKGKRLFKCVAGKSIGVIYQNGDVALCEFYKPIGNLKNVDFDLSTLWHNKEAEKQRSYIKKCFCHHDCFINTEYNFRFMRRLASNVNKFIKFYG